MDENREAPAPETTMRRSKRTRVQKQISGENRSRSSESSDGSHEKFGGEDDFVEDVRPKAKRNRTSEGSSAAAHDGDLTLMEVIKGDGRMISHAVKLWVEEYEKNQACGMAELLTMLFEACGAKYYVKGETLEETDVDDVVVALVNLARRGEVEDFQSSKKEFKNFKDNLVSFWDNLVVECQNGPLFDKVIFDKCMDYIIALSCTPPRVYRQVASLMGLQLVTSLISVTKVLGTQRETTQRQLNAEKKKQADGPRIDSLQKRLSVAHEKINLLEDMMRKIFTGLFVHRYRDVDPNIRMSCIQSLGAWILAYPSLFLQDLYLKYLGWTLNDKNAGVRKASVIALQNLYELEDNVPNLHLFTQRFSNRMIELADDIDVSVAVSAIGLVKQLLRHQLLPDDDLGPLYDLLIDDPPEIRRAIGELVYDHLIAQKFNSSQSSSKGNQRVSSEVHLSRMLQILKEFSTDPILSSYVIDDVWEYMKAMKDWKCIISMLLDENPSIELTDDDATNLIRLLSASARKAVGERIVPASDNRKPHYTKAQKELLESNRRDITIAMMKNYPLLLRKFMADKAKVSALVEIISCMNVELYSLKRQEQNFIIVLELMKEAFFKHGEKEALRSCVTALKLCTTESQGELQDFSRNKLKDLEDELISKLKSALKEVADGGDEYSLLVNSKRLYELQLSRHVPIESLFDEIIAILCNFRNLDEEVVSFLLLNLYLLVAWSLHSVVNSESVSEAFVCSLLSKRNALFEQLEFYLNTLPESEGMGKYRNQLACRVCIIHVEAWCLFRETNFGQSKLKVLGCCPDKEILEKFWKLCELQLNVSDETESEDANKEYIEDTNRDAVMIAASKLIASDTVSPDYLGPEIISHFVMHGVSVSEVVKHLITILKKTVSVSTMFLEALKRAYGRHLAEISKSDDESMTGKSFRGCKELAARLSGTFVGAARNQHKLAIVDIVNDGIDYAFAHAPKQLSFLEACVTPFISKLPSDVIINILKGVRRRTEGVNTEEDPSGWRPYHVFVDTIHEKYAKNEAVQDDEEGSVVKRRGRPRKQQKVDGKRLFNEHSSSEEEDSITGSDQETGQDEQKQDEEEDEDAPLIQSLKPLSKLRSLKVSREDSRSKAKSQVYAS